MRPGRFLVISLARRADRLAAFRQRWQAAAGPDTPACEVIDAVDQPDAPTAGCWQSHLNALRSGAGPVLIMEDDCTFTADFTLDLPQPPPDWSLLRLGGWLRAGIPAGGPWTPVVQVSHTHAYVARDPAALAGLVEANKRRDVGTALTYGIAGHYRQHPATTGQAAGHSDISGRDTTADEYWK